MVIIQDTTGITIKRDTYLTDHVRIGIFKITLWKNGVRRSIRDLTRPHCEVTINECQDLLSELERM